MSSWLYVTDNVLVCISYEPRGGWNYILFFMSAVDMNRNFSVIEFGG